DITGALVSFWTLFAFTKIWRPKTIRSFGGEQVARTLGAQSARDVSSESGSALRAWSPYIVIILVVVAWTGPWSRLPSYSLLRLSIQAVSSITGQPFTSAFNLNPLSGGTAILVSWLIILMLLRPASDTTGRVLRRTFHHMR